MNAELKPCPFCGGEAVLTQEDCYGYYHDDWLVFCEDCDLYLGFARQYAKEQAIAAWNRRANLGSCENELIVRCENCKHYNRIGCSDGFGWCERMDRGVSDDFYCSLAEMKEQEKTA